MKTPEDEAFDDLARRQGAWGGGFQAKRQAAMDKVNAEFYEEYIKYRTAFPKGYIAPPKTVQEPVGMLHIEPLDKWLDASLKERKQREWVGLTDEEIAECFKVTPDQYLTWHIYKRIEAKLKEKNT